MQEADQLIVCAWLGFRAEQSKACSGQPVHLGAEIGDFECDMVHAFAFLIDVAGDDAVGGQPLEQFDLGLSFFEKCGIDLFAGYFFCFVTGGIQQLFKKGDGNGKIFYGDANMLDFIHVCFFIKNKLQIDKQPMKRISSLILLVFALSVSCHKKNNSPAPAPSCQIISYTDTLPGPVPSISRVMMAYNSKGQLVLLQTLTAGMHYNKIYTYSGDTAVITTPGVGYPSDADSAFFNDQGQVVSFRSLQGGFITRYDYSYNNDGTVNSKVYSNGSVTFKYDYHYTNGDLMAVTIGSDTLESYTYDTKRAAAAGDYWQHSQILLYGGGMVVKCDHLVTSFKSSVTEDFSYSFDGNSGRIVGMNTEDNGSEDRISYDYYCE